MANEHSDRERPLYMISVAADLAGVHPQTLRIYERKRLVFPKRSLGNTRLYSSADVDRLRFIQQLTQEEGVNLAGVTRIIELQREVERLDAELRAARDMLRRADKAAHIARENVRRYEVHTALVRVDRGAVMRREG
ncbi:MAG: helix-turn-helix transcriptional regulator [Coriobacteriia bacterium]|nr:helix-turn-helix transcriptional regulator [Coriobacteriia bacterium]